ncbi:hypothetical protein SELMODRAFT_423978 [Selaginella moellendorffii]|uniref:Metallo-beta-lactamase domain-containing protein n=1 Tax=Selaginella moellendorffii TaxID=88036 RepID=D8SNE5_SELML|nr:hypothetical protein SELMODRAFT_423978 [Selaginella moellendorffii]
MAPTRKLVLASLLSCLVIAAAFAAAVLFSSFSKISIVSVSTPATTMAIHQQTTVLNNPWWYELGEREVLSRYWGESCVVTSFGARKRLIASWRWPIPEIGREEHCARHLALVRHSIVNKHCIFKMVSRAAGSGSGLGSWPSTARERCPLWAYGTIMAVLETSVCSGMEWNTASASGEYISIIAFQEDAVVVVAVKDVGDGSGGHCRKMRQALMRIASWPLDDGDVRGSSPGSCEFSDYVDTVVMIGQASTFQKDSTIHTYGNIVYMKCTSTIRSTSRTSVLSPSTETGTLQIRCVLADSRQLLYTDGFPVSKQCTALLLSTKTPRESSLTLLDFKVMEAHVWVWTSMSKMRLQFRNGIKKHEPQVFEIITFPKFGIGQRAFLIQTQEGNILWDCISFLDDATVEITKSLGGLRAIAISHPHYYSTNSRWSEAFGGVLVYTHECTKRLSSTMGGTHAFSHFAVAQILHWSHGAQGRGVLFTGDILQVGMDNKTVGMDNKTVSIMRSYPSYIPLSSMFDL